MKRWITGSLIFFVTLAIGVFLARPTSTDHETGLHLPEPLPEPPEHQEITFLATPKDEEATGEFHDLTNFEDIIYPSFTIDLVDIHEFGNAYRKNEVIAKSGEQWLGLFEQDGKYFLRKTTVSVKFDPDYLGYGDEDYVRLTTAQPGNPIFILKNAGSLRSGAIKTTYLRPSFEEIEKRNLRLKELSIGYKEHFDVGDHFYTLRVVLGRTSGGDMVNVLVLENQGESQIVTYNYRYEEHDYIGHLLWVGDLDGDGKLDLYFDDWTYEKGGFGSNLYLSSEAEEGQLVKQVAGFGAGGC